MVGNDVVDLTDPETDAAGLNPRFDARVFTTDERRRLDSAADPHTLRWTLWAAKESAYKVIKRLHPDTVFAHRRFVTELAEDGNGVVHHDRLRCRVASRRQGSSIHAVATAGPGHGELLTAVGRVEPGHDPGLAVRALATAAVARHLAVEPASVRVERGRDRIPMLTVGGRVLGHISLSHHGAVAAFAWLAPGHR